jgi:SAM-dependent methyltransferase
VTVAEVRAAYDAAGASWAGGPDRVYGVLAALLLDAAPPLSGALLLDAGAGAGAVSRVAVARGARVVAVDVSVPMLRHARAARPPAVAGSVDRLPLRDNGFDVAAVAFCLNHLAEPVAALRELRRVVKPGGAVVASVFATGNEHPAKSLVDARLTALGWHRPPWYAALKDSIEPRLADPAAFAGAAIEAGLGDVTATVGTAEGGALDDPADLVAWRLGMAHAAPFVAALAPGERESLRAALVREVRDAGQPFRPRVVVLSSRRAA